jgi:glycosyltransferase involved in cell wall biosynthesis
MQSVDIMRGLEDFEYPGTYDLLNATGERVDVLHCHNLHGGYFDLRALPALSARVPTMLTLHDAWLLSGHCAHSFDCNRWLQGCGHCPDLTIYPAVRRDATAHNWVVKREMFVRSRLHVATPSRWLMNNVERSILQNGIVDSRVIPNGVDLKIFRPENKNNARSRLGIPHDAAVVLFVGHGIQGNRWKDFQTMREAIALSSCQLAPRHVLFFGLGEEDTHAGFRSENIRFAPFVEDAACVAAYYQAADVYLHAAKVDTFPQVVLEALACGTPVVATAVGGIPEQVRSLSGESIGYEESHSESSATGILVPPGDPQACARAIVRILTDSRTQKVLSENAAADASARFGLDRQIACYVDWYAELAELGGSHRLRMN